MTEVTTEDLAQSRELWVICGQEERISQEPRGG